MDPVLRGRQRLHSQPGRSPCSHPCPHLIGSFFSMIPRPTRCWGPYLQAAFELADEPWDGTPASEALRAELSGQVAIGPQYMPELKALQAPLAHEVMDQMEARACRPGSRSGDPCRAC